MKVKCCWLAREYKQGWSLAVAIKNKIYTIPKIRLLNEKEVKCLLNKNIVFVHIKEKQPK